MRQITPGVAEFISTDEFHFCDLESDPFVRVRGVGDGVYEMDFKAPMAGEGGASYALFNGYLLTELQRATRVMLAMYGIRSLIGDVVDDPDAEESPWWSGVPVDEAHAYAAGYVCTNSLDFYGNPFDEELQPEAHAAFASGCKACEDSKFQLSRPDQRMLEKAIAKFPKEIRDSVKAAKIVPGVLYALDVYEEWIWS